MKQILVLTLIFFMIGCSNTNKEINSEFSETKAIELCLSDNADFQRYLNISKEILFTVADCELSEEEIFNLFQISDFETLYDATNSTPEDIKRYDSLSIYAERLMVYYSVTEGECSLCSYSPDELSRTFVSIVGWIRTNPSDFNEFEPACTSLKDSGGGTRCRWVQYIACMGACCTLPPYLNALCVVACYCEFCTRESGHPMNSPCGQASTQ